MNSLNILFYSNRCQQSKDLISLLNNEGLTKYFHLICVDNNPNVLPNTQTPTLVIRGMPTPYIKGDAFTWLSRVKQWKNQMLLRNFASAQQQFIQTMNNNLTPDNNNLLGFNKLEMQQMSDMFSFFESDMKNEIDSSFPQMYVNYNQVGHESIFTPPKESGFNKVKADKAKQLEEERKKQDHLFKKSIEEFHKQLK